MKVITYWWGIELVSDNEEDEILLKELHERVGNKADSPYEDGDIETDTESAKSEFSPDYSGFTLRFSR